MEIRKEPTMSLRRLLALALCLCMVCGLIPAPAHAQTVGQLCEHHPAHTADCGYAEAVQASPCTHRIELTSCKHVCDPDTCMDAEGNSICTHVCTVENGCITLAEDPTHVHDDSCGYAEASEGSPCTYVCTECGGEPVLLEEEPEAEPEQPLLVEPQPVQPSVTPDAAGEYVVRVSPAYQGKSRYSSLSEAFVSLRGSNQKTSMMLVGDDPTPSGERTTIEGEWSEPFILYGGEYSVPSDIELNAKIDLTITGGKFSSLKVGSYATVHLSGGTYNRIRCTNGTVGDLLADGCYFVDSVNGTVSNDTSGHVIENVTVERFHITQQPQDVKVLVGQTATLSIKTEPDAGVSYSWKLQEGENTVNPWVTSNPWYLRIDPTTNPDIKYWCDVTFHNKTISSEKVQVIGTYLLPKENPTLIYGTDYDARDYFDFSDDDDSVKNDTTLSYRLKDGAEDSWTAGSPTDAGVYCVKAAYTINETTYAETIDLTIDKAEVAIQWENTSQSYTGSPLAPTAKGVWKDSKGVEKEAPLTVSVTETAHTMPGTYHATVVGFEKEADASNLTLPQNCETTFTITKAKQPKPTGMEGKAGDIRGKGTIQGLTTQMEWAVSNSAEPVYTPVTNPDNTFFESGYYWVRYAETETHQASQAAHILVPEGGEALTVTLPSTDEQTNNHYSIDSDKAEYSYGETATLTVQFKDNYIGTVMIDGEPQSLTYKPDVSGIYSWTYTITHTMTDNIEVTVEDVSPAFSCDDIEEITYDGKGHGELKLTYDTRIEALTQKREVEYAFYDKNDDADAFAQAPSNTGNYGVDIHVDLDGEYAGVLTDEFSIVPKELTVKWPVNTTLTYNRLPQAPEPTVTGVLREDTVQWVVTGKGRDAGNYTAVLQFIDGENDNGNYKLPQNTSCAYTITKKTQTSVPNVTAQAETISGKGDGKLIGLDYSMEIQFPGTTTFVPYNTSTPEVYASLPAGTYQVRYAETDNYTASGAIDVTIGSGRKLTLTLPQNGVGYTISANVTELDWHHDDAIVTLTYDDYYEGGSVKAKVGENTVELEMIPPDSADSEPQWLIPSKIIESDVEILVEDLWESQPPTGSIKVGDHTWEALPETDSSVFVTAPALANFGYGDDLSGVKAAQYRVAYEKLSSDDLKELSSGWTSAMNMDGPLPLQTGAQYLYLKVTDEYGNVTYVGTDRLVVYDEPWATSETVNYMKYTGNLPLIGGETDLINVRYSDISSATMDKDNQSLKGTSLLSNSSSPYLKEDYLNSLSEGEHTLTLTLGSLYGVTLPESFTPKTLTLRLNIQKNNEYTVELTRVDGKEYNGNPIVSYGYSLGNPKGPHPKTGTFQHRLKGNTDWEDGMPVNAGTYEIRMVAGDDVFATKYSNVMEATIEPKPLPVTATVKNKVEDNTKTAEVTKWTLDTNAIVKRNNVPDDVSLDKSKSAAEFETAAPGKSVRVTLKPVLTGEHAPNYTATPSTDAAATIYIDPVEGTHYEITPKANSGGWYNTPVTVKALNGYKLSTTDAADGTVQDVLTVGDETADGKLTFYVCNDDNTAVSKMVEQDYKLDKTAPTGTIKYNGSVLPGFSSYCWPTDVNLSAETSDALSGVASVAYFISGSQMSQEALQGMTDGWKALPESGISMTGPENRFYFYVKVTDNAGNSTILESVRVTIDQVAPVFKEVEEGTIVDGGIYYDDVTLTCVETYLLCYMVNGVSESPAPTLTLYYDEDVDQNFTVQAVDNAGNRSKEVTIHLNRIPFQLGELGEQANVTVFYGETATLTANVTALENKTLQYQWYQKVGGELVALDGQKGQTLTLTGLASSAQPYQYVCRVTCEGYELDTEVISVTVLPARVYLPEGIRDVVQIEGRSCQVTTDSEGKPMVELEDGKVPQLLCAYSFNEAGKYPDGMTVCLVKPERVGVYQATVIDALENLLGYEGCSVRIDGTPGIRMITSINKNTKSALIDGTISDLALWQLQEYGTLVQWQDALNGDLTMDTKLSSAYAYKRDTADPIFARSGDYVQYTNVLVWRDANAVSFARDLAMRPYLILTKGNETITLYGGTVVRSIGQIAQQIKDLGVYKAGSAGDKYVQAIIDKAAADAQG